MIPDWIEWWHALAVGAGYAVAVSANVVGSILQRWARRRWRRWWLEP